MANEFSTTASDDTDALIGTSEPYASLAGQLLVATPHMDDTRFERAVVLLCAHNEDGALGVVVNMPLQGLSLTGMLEQLEIDSDTLDHDPDVYNGGPVAESRGFVIHSGDMETEDGMDVPGGFGLSSSLATLKTIAAGDGPKNYLIALGYAGWSAGQLESELGEDAWHMVPADNSLVFHIDREQVWQAAMVKMGISDPGKIAPFVGRA